ncbi:MAG: amidohydrolase family protein [Reyranella sp.]|uniref:amidohydrolase family protein n=1 Tax=Reyranella sp. TaxID=1929291 RepID=UPI003D1387CE
MGTWLSEREQRLVAGAEEASAATPIPTQIVSNGEYLPPPQSATQRKVEARINELADANAGRLGLNRRQFLRTGCGMAAAFVAMNEIYGNVFQVNPAEARQPEITKARAEGLAGQFIFDVQTHFVRDDFDHKGLLDLAKYASEHWNPKLKEEGVGSLGRYKFQNYVKEVFYDSDTSLALLSGAPFDDPTWWFLSNEQMAKARELINGFAGSRRLLSHALITPNQKGWMDEVDKAIAVHKPDSWKGYTIGDPLNPSKYPWRLDDEKVMYPFYDKAVKAGITTICIHKGLLPPDYEKSYAGVWEYATAADIGKAAKDWPQMNFVMYHACLRPAFERPDQAWSEFEQTGRIRWATDLAEIPQKFGVTNVYAELGTAFANSAVAHPKFCAALVGTLIKGMGADHVLWGTDSVWYGSPQWQIEAMRRLEIPEDMQKKYGFPALGHATSATKQLIFSANATRMYNIKLKAASNTRMPAYSEDGLAALKKEYALAAREPSNLRYGYVRTE